MRPILVRWRGVTVWSYPAMLYCGLVAGVTAGNVAAHFADVDRFRVFVAMLLLIIPCLVGAKLLYAATHWNLYRRNLRRLMNRNQGGAAMYGGLLVSLPLSVPLTSVLSVPLGVFWDIATFTMLVGMIFARIGCLLNGCCAGRRTKILGVYSPNHCGVWEKRVPTQALEAGWASILLVAAILIWQSLPFAGALFLLVCASYGLGRFALEATRENSHRFTIHHAISLFLVVSSVATFRILLL
jgi:phosphatidylglycerol:prolipoprotein diacylglycerol transferase